MKKVKINKCLLLTTNANIFAMDNLISINTINNNKGNNNHINTNTINNNIENTNIIDNNKENSTIYKHNSVKKVKGDGNCLFNLLSNLFFGTEEYHFYFRQFLSANKGSIENLDFLVNNVDFKNEVENLKNSKVFGTDFSIAVFSNVFKLNVAIHHYVEENNKITEYIYKLKQTGDLNSVVHIHLYNNHFFSGSFNMSETALINVQFNLSYYVEGNFFKTIDYFNNKIIKDLKIDNISDEDKFPAGESIVAIKNDNLNSMFINYNKNNNSYNSIFDSFKYCGKQNNINNNKCNIDNLNNINNLNVNNLNNNDNLNNINDFNVNDLNNNDNLNNINDFNINDLNNNDNLNNINDFNINNLNVNNNILNIHNPDAYLITQNQKLLKKHSSNIYKNEEIKEYNDIINNCKKNTTNYHSTENKKKIKKVRKIRKFKRIVNSKFNNKKNKNKHKNNK